MRVLLVTPVYPPVIGGPAQQTKEIASVLTRHGHTATVLTTSEHAESSTDFEVIHLPARRRRFDRVPRNLRLLRDLHAVLKRVGPDLVHMQTCEGNLPLALGAVARAQQLPRLIKFSSDAVWSRMNRDRHLGVPYQQLHTGSLRGRGIALAQRATLQQYNLIWATSPFQERALHSTYGMPASAVHALPNLIRVEQHVARAASMHAELVALLVARLVPTKAIEIAIQAVAKLRDRPVRLRIVGSGTPQYEATLRQQCVEACVTDCVEFVGEVPADRLAAEYAAADLFLLPSWYEAFGMVLVQAMAAGLPCVASDVGGIPSVVRDGETGLLVPAGDASALAAAMCQLEDASLREQLGARGRSEAQRFDLETRFEDLLAMYQRAIANFAR